MTNETIILLSIIMLAIILLPLLVKHIVKTTKDALIDNTQEGFESNILSAQMNDLDKALTEARTTWAVNTKDIADEFKDLSKSFNKWEQALSNTGQQGRLAEEGLQVMLEQAGLVEGASFDKQITEEVIDGFVRPDFYVYGADGSAIVIDSKAPLKKYEEAINADNDDIKNQKLRENASNMLDYAAALGANDYTQAIGRPTPDIVIMYVPYIGVYLSALKVYPDLHARAWAHRVQICPPETMYPILKNFMLSWQQKKLYENAEEIQKQTIVIHERIKKFQEYFIKIGRSLTAAARVYNSAVKSWDSRLTPSLKKIETMGIANEESRQIPSLTEIDEAINVLSQDDQDV